MKRKTIQTLVALLCAVTLLSGLTAGFALGGKNGDFRYTRTADGVTLTSYTGTDANPTIPDKIGDTPVVAIGDGCFQGNVALRRVHIPEGVKTIGAYAFEACSALQRVYFPVSLQKIGEGAFSGCGHLTLADLQDQITSIGSGAFLCCDQLVQLELPATLTELGQFAFAHCASLARVQFADGCKLKTIPDRAFYGCTELTAVSLPESVTAIGKRAFSHCESLRTFYHGTTLDRLGSYAFEGCEAMASCSVVAPTIEAGTFYGCSRLEYLSLSEGVRRLAFWALSSSNVQDLTLADTVTEIEPGAFYGSAVRSVTLGEDNAAYTVRDGALLTKDGKTLVAWFPADPYAEEPQTDFAVPEGVETIASYAFALCPLTHITLPDSLKAIDAYAFAGTDVTDMVIPEGVTVDPNAFVDPDAPDAAQAFDAGADANGSSVTTRSAAGDKSLYREADYKDYHQIANEEFESWSEAYLAYNAKQGNPLSADLIPYIMRYKGEVIPHFMAMTAVQNHDPEMWANAANQFGDDFEQMYLMMNHGLFTELRRGRMQEPLILYSGVYDSQLMAAAGTDTVPTRQQLIDAIGHTFSDPVMISTTPDPAVACGFGDTLFIIYASPEAMEALGAVCMDAVVHTSENEILMAANARYRVLDVGDMTVTSTDPMEGSTVTEQRSYVRVELLAPEAPKVQNPFVDVKPDTYYCDSVLWAVGNGVTDGMDDTHFAPDGSATRAQTVTFLWRANGSPEPGMKQNPFADVSPSAWYYKAVLWAVEQGITDGTSDTTFSPNDTCTRAHVVTFLWRTALCPAVSMENPFRDVPAGKYYVDAVLWAASNGITDGTTEHTFSPDSNCTRAQIVTFLYRAEQ